jgi:hypothetical protein
MSKRTFLKALLILTLSMVPCLFFLDIGQAALVFEGQPLNYNQQLTDGQTLDMVLRIYDDQFKGRLLYEEKQKVEVQSQKACFRFAKGEITSRKNTLQLPPEKLWVEVESNGQKLLPRLNLAELDIETDLTGASQSLSRSSLRTAGSSALIISNDGATIDGSLGIGIFRVENDTTNGEGLHGKATGKGGTGVKGEATTTEDGLSYGGHFAARSSEGVGVYGASSGADGSSVMGVGLSPTAQTNGVKGTTLSPSGHGIHGEASGINATAVYGKATTTSTTGKSFGGYFTAAAKGSRGVYGESTGSDGYGVYGYTTGANATSIYGRSGGTESAAIYGENSGSSGKAVVGKASNVNSGETYGGYFTHKSTLGAAVYAKSAKNTGIIADGGKKGGDFIAYDAHGIALNAWAPGAGGYGVKGAGGTGGYDFYANGDGANYGPFTGAHDVRLSPDFPEGMVAGKIVSVTGQAESRLLQNGSVSLSTTLPTVTLACTHQDKAVLGVLVSQGPLPKDHWYKSLDGERFGIVNALGEGRVWVTNAYGDIEAGDYITTSEIDGYGRLQNDDLVHSYTVGKAIESIDWDDVSETITVDGKEIKIYLIAVVYTCG